MIYAMDVTNIKYLKFLQKEYINCIYSRNYYLYDVIFFYSNYDCLILR